MGKKYATQYQAGTVIGEIVCVGHGCTKVLPVKIGKSDKAYIYCLQDRGTQSGGCGFRGYFGRQSSDAMILEWEKQNEKSDNIQASDETDVNGRGGEDENDDGNNHRGQASGKLWFE